MESVRNTPGPHPGPVGVLGLGRVGCQVVVNLLQVGFTGLVLADHRPVTARELEDHPFFKGQDVGRPRSQALQEHLRTSDPQLEVQAGSGPGGPGAPSAWHYEGLSGCRAVVFAADGAVAPLIHEVNAAFLELRVPLFPGIVLGPVAQLGPRLNGGSEESGRGACLHCLELRIAAAADRPPYPPPSPRRRPPSPPLVWNLAAALVASLVSFLREGETDALLDQVLYLSPRGAPRRHSILRTPRCQDCGPLGPFMPYRMPPDPAARQTVAPDPRRILRRSSQLVDPWCGVLRSLHRQPAEPVDPGIEVWVSQPASLDDFAPVGGGFSRHPEEAQAAALGEALERAAVSVECPEDLQIAPYCQVAEHALDPEAWDLFHPGTRRLADFPYAPLSPETPLSWVWGTALAPAIENRRAVLVPASRIFMRFPEIGPGDTPDGPLVSGFATGSSLEEATLRGLLEVLERDSFMIAWANRLPMRRVPVNRTSPHGVGDYVAAIEDRGLRVRCATLTLDLGVYLVVSLLRFPGPLGEATIVTAAADLDLARACRRAIKEGAAGPPLIRRHYADARGRLPEPVPEQVTRMEDHALLYARPDMFEHLQPWWRPDESLPLEDTPRATHAGPEEALEQILGALNTRHLTAVRVDLTHPALSRLGLFTVKVTVPGTYPMNFDSRFPHIGGERLYRAPMDAGLRQRPLRPEELNPIPHPFP